MARRPRWLEKTEGVLDEQTAPPPGERKYAQGPDAHTLDRGTLRHEQQEEISESWFGLGFLTDAQFKGAVVGSVLGALVGALVFLPVGLIAWDGVGLGWQLLIAALCGGLAGATAAAIYFGGREPELEGETRDLDGPSVGTTLRDPHTDDRGR